MSTLSTTQNMLEKILGSGPGPTKGQNPQKQNSSHNFWDRRNPLAIPQKLFEKEYCFRAPVWVGAPPPNGQKLKRNIFQDRTTQFTWHVYLKPGYHVCYKNFDLGIPFWTPVPKRVNTLKFLFFKMEPSYSHRFMQYRNIF